MFDKVFVVNKPTEIKLSSMIFAYMTYPITTTWSIAKALSGHVFKNDFKFKKKVFPSLGNNKVK